MAICVIIVNGQYISKRHTDIPLNHLQKMAEATYVSMLNLNTVSKSVDPTCKSS